MFLEAIGQGARNRADNGRQPVETSQTAVIVIKILGFRRNKVNFPIAL
jgi:hypothetical protein